MGLRVQVPSSVPIFRKKDAEKRLFFRLRSAYMLIALAFSSLTSSIEMAAIIQSGQLSQDVLYDAAY